MSFDTDDLCAMRDRVSQLSTAAELAQQLGDVLSRLEPRRPLESYASSDAARDRCLEEVYRLEGLLAAGLRRVEERRNRAFSPIYRLDDDTWRAILLYAYDTIPKVDQRVRMVIWWSHVSREWRRIALDTAGLWIDRVITTPFFSPTPPWGDSTEHRRYRKMNAAFASRSKGALLDQIFNMSRDEEPDRPSEFCRTKSLSIYAYTLQGCMRVLEGLPDSRETLQRLRIQLSFQLDTARPSLEDFGKLLGLKSAGVRELCLNQIPSIDNVFQCEGRLCLHACRTLELQCQSASPGSLGMLMESCSALKRLTLNILGQNGVIDLPESWETPSSSRILMPALEALDLTLKCDTLDFVLGKMRAPMLRMLSIKPTFRGLPDEESEQGIANGTRRFLLSSSPPLRHLEVITIPFKLVAPILVQVPDLTALICSPAFPLGDVDGSHISILAPSQGTDTGTLCASLRTFVWRGQASTEALAGLLEMVRARSNSHIRSPTSVKPLQQVKLSDCSPVCEEQKPYMEALASAVVEFAVGPWTYDSSGMIWRLDSTSREW